MSKVKGWKKLAGSYRLNISIPSSSPEIEIYIFEDDEGKFTWETKASTALISTNGSDIRRDTMQEALQHACDSVK